MNVMVISMQYYIEKVRAERFDNFTGILFQSLFTKYSTLRPYIPYFVPQGHKARTWVMPQGQFSK
jgi:hypothetical protein